jgi:hypothetical protein
MAAVLSPYSTRRPFIRTHTWYRDTISDGTVFTRQRRVISSPRRRYSTAVPFPSLGSNMAIPAAPFVTQRLRKSAARWSVYGPARRPVARFFAPDCSSNRVGDAELPAQLAHAFAVQKTADEAYTLIHHRTRSPRHQHLPPKREKCYPCVRYKPSPMARVGHTNSELQGRQRSKIRCNRE